MQHAQGRGAGWELGWPLDALQCLKPSTPFPAGPLAALPPPLAHPGRPPSPPSLQEAAGLSVLFQQVDEHFASGNLPRLADALAGMRRGLAVVGDSVAEFRGG